MLKISVDEIQSEVEPRPSGLCAGQFTVPDDLDAPLPEDIIASFEGKIMNAISEFKMDKTAFSVVSLTDELERS